MSTDERQVEKLTIERYEDQDYTQRVEDGTITVMFNPGEMTLTRSNSYNQQQAQGASRPETSYAGGQPDQLSIQLMYDATGVMEREEGSTVRDDVDALLSLMRYEGEEHRPHYLRVSWGDFKLQCILKTANVTFKLFDRQGEPLRATVACSFEEVMPQTERTAQERSSSPDLLRVWTVAEGETIDGIAFRAYGSPEHWRLIAESNGLANPRHLPGGLVLELPVLAR